MPKKSTKSIKIVMPKKKKARSRRSKASVTSASLPFTASSSVQVRPATTSTTTVGGKVVTKVTGCGLVNSIEIPNGTTNGTIVAQIPLSAEMEPRLEQITKTFENYKFKRGRFIRVPALSAMYDGSILMYFDFDPEDDPSSMSGLPLLQEAADHEFNSSSPIYVTQRLDIKGDDSQPPRYTSNVSESSSRYTDPRFSISGVLTIIYSGPTTSSAISAGNLFVEYELQLLNPQLVPTEVIPPTSFIAIPNGTPVGIAESTGSNYSTFYPLDFVQAGTEFPVIGRVVSISTSSGAHNAFLVPKWTKMAYELAISLLGASVSTNHFVLYSTHYVGYLEDFQAATWNAYSNGDAFIHTGLSNVSGSSMWYNHNVITTSGSNASLNVVTPLIARNNSSRDLYFIPAWESKSLGIETADTFTVAGTVFSYLTTVALSAFTRYIFSRLGPLPLASDPDSDSWRIYHLDPPTIYKDCLPLPPDLDIALEVSAAASEPVELVVTKARTLVLPQLPKYEVRKC